MAIALVACVIALLGAVGVSGAAAGGTAPVASKAAGSGGGKLALRGTWTGHRERIASRDGYRSGPATLRVTEQTGLTFKGRLTWSTPDGPMTEPLIGAYTPGGRLISGVDEAGTYTFSLVSRTTLDYCYAEHDEDGYRTNCGRLKKQG